MEQIIKKAIEGGWNPEIYRTHRFYNVKNKAWHQTTAASIDESAIFLDPLFWQALGKAYGWTRNFAMASYGTLGRGDDMNYEFDGDKKEDFSIEHPIPEWQYRSLRFHEINLTEGWEEAVEYLSNLIE